MRTREIGECRVRRLITPARLLAARLGRLPRMRKRAGATPGNIQTGNDCRSPFKSTRRSAPPVVTRPAASRGAAGNASSSHSVLALAEANASRCVEARSRGANKRARFLLHQMLLCHIMLRRNFDEDNACLPAY